VLAATIAVTFRSTSFGSKFWHLALLAITPTRLDHDLASRIV
jgi:hypothetical protein